MDEDLNWLGCNVRNFQAEITGRKLAVWIVKKIMWLLKVSVTYTYDVEYTEKWGE